MQVCNDPVERKAGHGTGKNWGAIARLWRVQEQEFGYRSGRGNFREYAGIPAAGRSTQRLGGSPGHRRAVPSLRGEDSATPDSLEGRVNGGGGMPPAGACIDPLYLFCCGVLWHKQAGANAGWEVIHSLRLTSPEARAIA